MYTHKYYHWLHTTLLGRVKNVGLESKWLITSPCYLVIQETQLKFQYKSLITGLEIQVELSSEYESPG